MQFSKYNKYKDGANVNITGTSSNSSSTTTEQPPSRGGSRVLWGQEDDGGDIKESMKIEGNIYIKATSGDDDEGGDTDEEKDEWTDTPDEEEFDFDWDEDTEGGSLYVEKKVKANEIESATDITAGRHLFINYPHPDHTGEKKCVGELIKTNADAISNLTTKVENNTTNISNNADEISKLKAGSLTEEDVLKLIRDNQPSKLGAYDQPVVLFTGRARRVSYYNDRYYMEGIKLPYFSLSNTISGGLMTISITPQEGYQVCIYGVHCNQERSGDTTDAIDNPTVTGRSDGAHWFECRVDTPANTKTVYIREMHQRNGDNDSWGTTDWFANGGIKAIHFTLIGYIMPPTT